MVFTQVLLGPGGQFFGAVGLGMLGLAALVVAQKGRTETVQTFLGLFAGVFLWTGFVEFSFVYYAGHLSVLPEVINGEIVTKPEYLILPSSIGLLITILAYFFFNGQTRCPFLVWWRRALRLKIPFTSNHKTKNYANITAIETICILWTFYTLLLIAYDPAIFGDRHPFTYSVLAGSLLWSGYLITKLLRQTRTASAIRYAIPTVIIFWNSVEILGRWNFFKEIWIEPMSYWLEISLILAAFAGVLVLVLASQKSHKHNPAAPHRLDA